jgi:hypothetical protein
MLELHYLQHVIHWAQDKNIDIVSVILNIYINNYRLGGKYRTFFAFVE